MDLPSDPIDDMFLTEAEVAFRAAYKARYFAEDPASPVEGVDWALAAVVPKSVQPPAAERVDVSPEPPTRREAWFPEAGGFTVTEVWRREAIGPETVIEGPAIVEDAEATTVLLPGDSARQGKGGHLIITIASNIGKGA